MRAAEPETFRIEAPRQAGFSTRSMVPSNLHTLIKRKIGSHRRGNR
jgi:hypothetical protein